MLPASLESHRGHNVRVARVGQGAPLVLLHGYPDNLQIFGRLVERLSTSFEVIAFDWPGLGQSEAWPGGTTPRHMAERLLALLDDWGLTDVHVVAMDMGVQPALVLAALHPERVRGLVAMNALVLWSSPISWELRVLRRYRWNERLLRLLPWVVFQHAVRSSLPRGLHLPVDVQADLWGCFRRPDVRRFTSRLCGGYQGALPQLPELYDRIRCPTLVLWGARDRHFPPSQGTGLHARIPGSRFELLEHGEHWMAWHRADEVAEQVLRHCARGVPG